MSPYEIQMLAGVNKEAKHLHPTDTHPLTHLHVTEYLPPSHHHLQPFHFSSLSFPSSPSVHCGGRRSFAFVAVEGKGRSGLHLSFASCYHFSHLYPLPTSAPLTGLPPSFCLWHTAIGLESSEWGKARAELTHDSELLTLQLGEPSATGWLLAWTCSQSVPLDNNPGILLPLAFASGRNTEVKEERKRPEQYDTGFLHLSAWRFSRFCTTDFTS